MNENSTLQPGFRGELMVAVYVLTVILFILGKIANIPIKLDEFVDLPMPFFIIADLPVVIQISGFKRSHFFCKSSSNQVTFSSLYLYTAFPSLFSGCSCINAMLF